jgi:hypothetical protein
MATIITVHGTFSSGPESGEKWWQKGSPLENELRSLVEGEDGRLDFVPHVWDGLNSENSRRAAGEELFNRLIGLEKKGERYCLIGHSHGGSVVLASLLNSTRRRRKLSGLSRWITVATPFIAFARKPLLFFRLGLLGKAALAAMLTYSALLALGLFTFPVDYYTTTKPNQLMLAVVVLVLAVVPYLFFHTIVSWVADRRIINSEAVLRTNVNGILLWRQYGILVRLLYVSVFSITVVACAVVALWPHLTIGDSWFSRLLMIIVFAVAFLFFHFLLAWILRVSNQRIGKHPMAAIAWSSRWLSLRHPQDEAIEGLSILPRISVPIFGKEFAVAPFTLASVIAFPMLIVAATLSPAFVGWLKWLTEMVGGKDENLNNIAYVIFALPFVMLKILGLEFSLFMVPLAAAIFFTAAIMLVAISRFIATVVSRLLSSVLDRVAWDQIRASAYGNDTLSENAQSAADTPSSISPQPPLPQSLAAEISKLADNAMAMSASKFRASFNRLAFAEDKRIRSDLISEYLTWDELVHTAYFKVPLFNKLLAYSIARSEGFRPTATFLADPDYIRVATWYGELTSGIRSETNEGPAQTDLGVKEMEPAVST